MFPLKVARLWRFPRQLAMGILVCFGVLGIVPDAYAQTDRVVDLIRQLKDSDASVRYDAARTLVEIKDPRAVVPLIAALKDPDSNVRRNSASWLGEIKDPRAAAPLIAALKDPRSNI
jgi:HEAT repeat protein